MIPRLITEHKKAIVAIFAAITVICAAMFLLVNTNYDMTDYLPEDAPSTVALDVMSAEFDSEMPNTRVMIENVTIAEALEYKRSISELESVSAVMWLDDVMDVRTPIELADAALVGEYYEDGAALFSVTIAGSHESEGYAELQALLGDDAKMSGDAINTAIMQDMTATETASAMLILVPLIIVILILTSTSWMEPVLFLAAIAVAILINMGTNALLGSVSNITMSISPILQMAVSLDYAIFLLHSFERHRGETDDVNEAMRRAIRSSFSSVTASGATTLFGFVSLLFMRFGLGSDLGLNLVKGIILSYISVMVFLPALTLCCYKLIDKSRHRRFIPQMKKVGVILKLRVPVLILALIVVIPCFLAQGRNEFTYGSGEVAAERLTADTQAIESTFGKSNPTVLLVPRGDVAREAELGRALKELPHVTSIMSYAETVGTEIPVEFVGSEVESNFYSENYARIILYADTEQEGEEAFELIANVRETAGQYYDTVHTCGQTAVLYDMKDTISSDSMLVNLIAIAAIAVVLLITFKSVTLPVILLFIIESAIWINLSVPYFSGSPIVYIGYLIINTVQLGATIDYAILLTDTYKRFRMHMPKMEAMKTAMGECFMSILTSAVIMSAAGFCLALTSSNSMVSAMGILLGRGTILSFLMVMCALPGLLLLLDKVVSKTTRNANFHKGISK